VKQALNPLTMVALLIAVSACSGRPVEPVTIERTGDADLTCGQIEHEVAANEAAAVALIRNGENSHNASVALDVDGRLVLGPALVALDTDDEEMGTLRALLARNQHLDQMAEEKYCGLEQARWIGQGPSDACGADWALNVGVEAGELRGTLWRGQVSYEVKGSVTPNGQVDEAMAIRSRSSFGWTGPKFIKLSMMLAPDRAEGEYSIDADGREACRTPVTLTRSRALAASAASSGTPR